MIDRSTTREQTLYSFHEVLAYCAADTSVRYLYDLFGRLLDELCVDISRTEFILDDGDLATFRISDDMIEECSLPTSEESGEDGDGDFFHDMEIRGYWIERYFVSYILPFILRERQISIRDSSLSDS